MQVSINYSTFRESFTIFSMLLECSEKKNKIESENESLETKEAEESKVCRKSLSIQLLCQWQREDSNLCDQIQSIF